MGVGWEYFNNVCKAMRVAHGFALGVVCLVVLYFAGGGVMQLINANRADPTLIVPPITTPAGAPAAKPNPQFKASASTDAAPAPAGVPPAVAPDGKVNPQFQPTRPAAPANAAAPTAPTDLKPNPQFAPNPQFHQ